MTAGPKIVMISATNTDCGKTTVIRALARLLKRKQKKVIAIKPVEVWCDRYAPGQEDGEAIAMATGQPEPRRALVPLKPSGVPALAADIEQVEIDFDGIVADIRRYAEGYDVCLVEGAGGPCTPVTWERDMLDLAHALDAPVVLIGTDVLQGASVVLMAMRAVRDAGVRLLGVAVNVNSAIDGSTGQNEATIRRVSHFERILTLRNVKLDAGLRPLADLQGDEAVVEAISGLSNLDTLAEWILAPDQAQLLPAQRR